MKRIALLSIAVVALAAPAFAADDAKTAPAATPAATTAPAAKTYTIEAGKSQVTVTGTTASVDGKAFTKKGDWKLTDGKTLTIDAKGIATVK